MERSCNERYEKNKERYQSSEQQKRVEQARWWGKKLLSFQEPQRVSESEWVMFCHAVQYPSFSYPPSTVLSTYYIILLFCHAVKYPSFSYPPSTVYSPYYITLLLCHAVQYPSFSYPPSTVHSPYYIILLFCHAVQYPSFSYPPLTGHSP